MTESRSPRIVRGRVTRHEPYGFWLDFGEPEEGVVVITMIDDDPAVASPAFPPIGSEVEAVLLGYTDIGNEPRLSMRPSDMQALRS
jgi:predicted RNA-binding protein with RPS1 domain